MNELITIRLRKSGNNVALCISSRLKERRWMVPSVHQSPTGFMQFVQREVAREIYDLFCKTVPENDGTKLMLHFMNRDLRCYDPLDKVARYALSCDKALLNMLPEPEEPNYRVETQEMMDLLVWCQMIVQPRMTIAV